MAIREIFLVIRGNVAGHFVVNPLLITGSL